MYREFEIKLKVKHINAIEALANAKTIDGQVLAVSKILNVSRDELYRVDIADFKELVSVILQQAQPTAEKPTKRIGDYTLVDFDNLPVGWYIDYDVLLEQHNGNLPHEYVMAFSYIERGKEWHEVDISKRAEYMREVEAVHYLNLMSFFLRWQTAIKMLRGWITPPSEKPKTHITG